VTLARLRELFDNMLVAEVQRHGGIPALPPEERAFREAMCAFLLEDEAQEAKALHSERAIAENQAAGRQGLWRQCEYLDERGRRCIREEHVPGSNHVFYPAALQKHDP
jgi:hypothetical protein